MNPLCRPLSIFHSSLERGGQNSEDSKVLEADKLGCRVNSPETDKRGV